MKITELKKQLNAMDKTELVILLCKLYKANRQCQAILDVEMCGTSAEAPIIESCRKKIHDAKERARCNQRFPKSIAE